VPVIGRLAVDRDYAGRGPARTCWPTRCTGSQWRHKSIGIGAVMVLAKSEAARRFYLSCAEFVEFPGESRTLFLPIETVVVAFGG
jgi:hypothetical protein